MKECFKCKTVKPLSDFYPHPQMADGHLNKCKECNRIDTNKRVALKKATDPAWVEQERERCRKKQMIANKSFEQAARKLVHKAIRDGVVQKKPCEVCGSALAQAHHEDYFKPIDVVWLCTRHHADRHIHLSDSETLRKPSIPISEWINHLQQPAS